MHRIFLSVFVLIVIALLGTIFTGSIQVIVVGAALLAYIVFVFLYYIIYFSFQSFFKEPLSETAKFFLLIPPLFILAGIYVWMNPHVIEQTRKNDAYIKLFRNELQNLPDDAIVRVSHIDFFASTKSIKDKDGKPVVFKWGDFNAVEVGSIGPYESADAYVQSLEQPKDIPEGLKCNNLFYLEDKNTEYVRSFSGKDYQFLNCPVKEWSFKLYEQQITLHDFQLNYLDNAIPENADSELIRNIKSEAAKLNLEKYWYVQLSGYFKIGDLWFIDKGVLFIDKAGKTIGLTGKAVSQRGFALKVGECMTPYNFSAYLTGVENKTILLSIDAPSAYSQSAECSTLHIDEPFIYVEKGNLDKDENKIVDNAQYASFLKVFSRIYDNNVYIRKSSSSLSIETNSDNDYFSWGDLDIVHFGYYGNEIWVTLANNSTVNFEGFICNKRAIYKRISNPFDNSLDKKNYSLAFCGGDGFELKIDHKPFVVNDTNVFNFVPSETEPRTKSYFFEKKNLERGLKSEYFTFDFDKSDTKPMIKIGENNFYISRIVTGADREIIALLGNLKPINEKEILTLGECNYQNKELEFTLFNFSEGQADMVLSDYTNGVEEPKYLNEDIEPCKVNKIQRHTYQILP